MAETWSDWGAPLPTKRKTLTSVPSWSIDGVCTRPLHKHIVPTHPRGSFDTYDVRGGRLLLRR
jgi:hypothetical protein